MAQLGEVAAMRCGEQSLGHAAEAHSSPDEVCAVWCSHQGIHGGDEGRCRRAHRVPGACKPRHRSVSDKREEEELLATSRQIDEQQLAEDTVPWLRRATIDMKSSCRFSCERFCATATSPSIACDTEMLLETAMAMEGAHPHGVSPPCREW